MKKIILPLVALLGFTMGAQAQQFSVGAGVNTRIYHLKEGPGTAPGLSLDFEANFRKTESFAFSVGAALTGSAGYHFKKTSMNLGEIYLDIPVRAKYYIPASSTTEFYLFGGLVPSLALVSIDAHSNGSTSNFDTYPLTRFDIMLGGGAGAEISERVRLTLGYDFGLLSRYKSGAGSSPHTSLVKLAAYYMF